MGCGPVLLSLVGCRWSCCWWGAPVVNLYPYPRSCRWRGGPGREPVPLPLLLVGWEGRSTRAAHTSLIAPVCPVEALLGCERLSPCAVLFGGRAGRFLHSRDCLISDRRSTVSNDTDAQAFHLERLSTGHLTVSLVSFECSGCNLVPVLNNP